MTGARRKNQRAACEGCAQGDGESRAVAGRGERLRRGRSLAFLMPGGRLLADEPRLALAVFHQVRVLGRAGLAGRGRRSRRKYRHLERLDGVAVSRRAVAVPSCAQAIQPTPFTYRR